MASMHAFSLCFKGLLFLLLTNSPSLRLSPSLLVGCRFIYVMPKVCNIYMLLEKYACKFSLLI